MKNNFILTSLQRKYFVFAFITLSALGFYACKDIIMPDLKGQKVAINSPLQNQTIRNYNVTFWWNPLEGAALYRFQVVQNRFDSLPIFRLDSTTTKTQITVTLKPSSKMKVLNSASFIRSTIPRADASHFSMYGKALKS